eukprot:1503434-Pyramimonas_sp.AAC.1
MKADGGVPAGFSTSCTSTFGMEVVGVTAGEFPRKGEPLFRTTSSAAARDWSRALCTACLLLKHAC